MTVSATKTNYTIYRITFAYSVHAKWHMRPLQIH